MFTAAGVVWYDLTKIKHNYAVLRTLLLLKVEIIVKHCLDKVLQSHIDCVIDCVGVSGISIHINEIEARHGI